jgi:hypothetical protein
MQSAGKIIFEEESKFKEKYDLLKNNILELEKI